MYSTCASTVHVHVYTYTYTINVLYMYMYSTYMAMSDTYMDSAFDPDSFMSTNF